MNKSVASGVLTKTQLLSRVGDAKVGPVVRLPRHDAYADHSGVESRIA